MSLSLDHSWIIPGLAIGRRIPQGMKPHGICFSRIIDLREEFCDDLEWVRCAGAKLLHLPTPDLTAPTQEMIQTGVHFARESLNLKENVLIHGDHGIGRSVLLAACVLVSLGHSSKSAMKVIKDARWNASPTPEQIQALITYSDIPQESRISLFNDLAEIAYQHLRCDLPKYAEADDDAPAAA